MRIAIRSLPSNRTIGCENAEIDSMTGGLIRSSSPFLPSKSQWEMVTIGMSKVDVANIIGSQHRKMKSRKGGKLLSETWEIFYREFSCKNYDKRLIAIPTGEIYWLIFDGNGQLIRKETGYRSQQQAIELEECLNKQKSNKELQGTKRSCAPLRP